MILVKDFKSIFTTICPSYRNDDFYLIKALKKFDSDLEKKDKRLLFGTMDSGIQD